jgi:cytosine/adenosine deaminase-related metal-dependent hydrolase
VLRGGRVITSPDAAPVDAAAVVIDDGRIAAVGPAAGLTWRQILASLTTSPADRFHEGGRRGRLAPGMLADVVVLGADPARDSRASPTCDMRSGVGASSMRGEFRQGGGDRAAGGRLVLAGEVVVSLRIPRASQSGC